MIDGYVFKPSSIVEGSLYGDLTSIAPIASLLHFKSL